jgi:hypothetical protein
LATPLRRLPHDLEGDVAAQRQPGEREAGRRRRQDPAGNGGDAGVAGVVGDRDRPKAPERWNLLGVKPRRAIQSGNKDDGEAIGGIGRHGGSFVASRRQGRKRPFKLNRRA